MAHGEEGNTYLLLGTRFWVIYPIVSSRQLGNIGIISLNKTETEETSY